MNKILEDIYVTVKKRSETRHSNLPVSIDVRPVKYVGKIEHYASKFRTGKKYISTHLGIFEKQHTKIENGFETFEYKGKIQKS